MVNGCEYLLKVQDQPGVAKPHSPLEVQVCDSRPACSLGSHGAGAGLWISPPKLQDCCRLLKSWNLSGS